VKSGASFGLFCLWLFVVVAGWLQCVGLAWVCRAGCSRKLGVLVEFIAFLGVCYCRCGFSAPASLTLRSSGTRLFVAVLKVCYFFGFGGFADRL
jgi:hypothetical protein